MRTKLLGLTLAAFAVAGTSACSEGTTASAGLSFSTRRAPGSPLSASLVGGSGASASLVSAGDSTILTLGNDSIIIRSVEMVLREIELKRNDVAQCPDSLHESDACEEFETGPVLVSLPLGNTTEASVSITVLPGTYDELEFKIHKPSASDDAAFLAAHPDFEGVSIRVQGSYSAGGNRSDFVFTTDLDKEQERFLSPPLVVSDGTNVNVTIRVDVSTWFLNVGGTALVDPATANKGGPNEGLVKNNIEQSIEALHDDDRDGLDDDHEE
jgi:hypothetical protein